MGLTVPAAAGASDRSDLNRECISTSHIADGTCSVCGVARLAGSSVVRSY